MAERLGRAPGRQQPGLSEVTLAHMYRADVQRSTAWRTRLDTTTNWAITTAAAVVSFSFSSQAAPPPTLLVGAAMVFTFLVVEARRYRYYDLWAQRVRLLEAGFLAPMLRREPATADFHAAFALELTRPRLRITLLEAITFRLRRTYAPIVALLLLAWPVKLDLHPVSARSLGEVVDRAAIGPLPGFVPFALWGATWVVFLVLLWRGYRTPLPTTELKPGARGRARPLGEIFREAGASGGRVPRREPLVRPASEEDRLGS